MEQAKVMAAQSLAATQAGVQKAGQALGPAAQKGYQGLKAGAKVTAQYASAGAQVASQKGSNLAKKASDKFNAGTVERPSELHAPGNNITGAPKAFPGEEVETELEPFVDVHHS